MWYWSVWICCGSIITWSQVKFSDTILADMKILLPSQFNEHTIFTFLSSVIRDGKPVDTHLEFDFSSLKFIDPVGLTVLSNTIKWLTKHGVTGCPINSSTYSAAVKYLDDSKFFETHLQSRQPLSPASRLRSTTLPLMHVEHSSAHNWLREKFIIWMSQRTHIPVDALSSISSSLMEIFNNIKDHSEEGIGCCFAQHFPNKNEVLLAISDFGVGIPSQMKKLYQDSDTRLIIKACQEGVSTKSIPTNRGAGLHLLRLNVVSLNSGSLSIYSNSGSVCFYKGSNGNQGVRTGSDNQGSNFYPGTLFVVTFRTDTIVHDEEEVFEW